MKAASAIWFSSNMSAVIGPLDSRAPQNRRRPSLMCPSCWARGSSRAAEVRLPRDAVAAHAARRVVEQLALLVGTSLSINILTGSSSSLASGALGAILAAYGAVGLAAPRFTVPPRAEPWLSPLIGLATGLITGATGVFAIPAVPYLSALGFTKDELIQALGLSFTVSTVALAVALTLSGKYQWVTVGSSLLAIVPALLGMFIGQRVRGRLEPEAFRRWFLRGLVSLGLYMLARALQQS